MATSDPRIVFEREASIARLRLNRPEKANALDCDMVRAITCHVAQIAEDETVSALLIEATGRNFSGGVDLKEFDPALATPERIEAFLVAWEEMIEALTTTAFVVIAAIRGPAIAGGLSLSLAADVRIASPAGTFGYPRVPDGHFPGQFNLTQLVRRIGKARTRLLLLAGQVIEARQAYEWGLVDALVAENEFDATLNHFLARIAQTPARLSVVTNCLIDAPEGDGVWDLAQRAVEDGDDAAFLRLVDKRYRQS